MAVLFDVLPLIASIITGIIVELIKQKMQFNYQNRQAEIRMMSETEKSLEAARSYETPHTSKVRKFLVIIITMPFLFPMLLEIYNWVHQLYWLNLIPHTPWMPGIDKACIYVPERVSTGGLISWIWENEKVIYEEVCGFVMFPIYVYSFQVVVGFYFGQAGAKLVSR